MSAPTKALDAQIAIWARELSRLQQENARLKNRVRELETEAGYAHIEPELKPAPTHELAGHTFHTTRKP